MGYTNWNTLLTLNDHANAVEEQELLDNTIQTRTETIDNLVISQNGKLLASSSSYGTIWLWDLHAGNLLTTIASHEDQTDLNFVGMGQFSISLDFSPDGKHLASGNMAGGVSLTDVNNSDLTQSLEPQSWRVLALAFSPDGKLLASGSKDTSINIYAVETGGKITTLRGHTGGVVALTFTEDSKTLVSGSMDGTTIFWDQDKIVDINSNVTLNNGIMKKTDIKEQTLLFPVQNITKEPIKDNSPDKPDLVSFRELIPEITDTGYLTHAIVSYPAKFIPQVVRYAINTYTEENDWIIDPFAGSGTVGVEAVLSKRNAVLYDLNLLLNHIMPLKVHQGK